jgi:hypothetical protein
MESIRLMLFAAAFFLASDGVVGARYLITWSYQDLLDKSDLAVIAMPTATGDTKERTRLEQFWPAIGVETTFAVSAVLKGDKAIKDFVLHHYRVERPYPNGPILVSFSTSQEKTYLLFLVRQSDGRYAPTAGQTDPGHLGISVLGSPPFKGVSP